MATTTVIQLVHDYKKVSTLAAGSLPARVVEMLHDTSADILVELVEVEPRDWDEFAAKVQTLVGALPADPTPGWLERVRDGLAEDLAHDWILSDWAPIDVAQAAA